MAGEAKQQLKNAAAGAAAEKKAGKSVHEPITSGSYKAPGRLGDPGMDLQDDPRVNAKLLAAVTPLGMNKFSVSPTLEKVNENSTIDEIAELIGEFEAGIEMMYSGKALSLEHPSDKDDPKVDQTEQTIKGGDGQDMKVYIYRPADQSSEKLPGVIYTHGGGMVINSTFNPVHDLWCRQIACNGAVVVMPDFRNAFTKNGYNHYPKGLNDCVAAAKWTVQNKESLKMRNVVLTGESGGGNLAIATSLQANRDGWIKDIAGVYPIVPYISNLYGATDERLLKELPSLVENQGYFLNRYVTSHSYLAVPWRRRCYQNSNRRNR